jgi:hypothetical protein
MMELMTEMMKGMIARGSVKDEAKEKETRTNSLPTRNRLWRLSPQLHL